MGGGRNLAQRRAGWAEGQVEGRVPGQGPEMKPRPARHPGSSPEDPLAQVACLTSTDTPTPQGSLSILSLPAMVIGSGNSDVSQSAGGRHGADSGIGQEVSQSALFLFQTWRHPLQLSILHYLVYLARVKE